MGHLTSTENGANHTGLKALKYELLLLLMSMVWGSAFAVQQIAMEKGLRPMIFTGLRFALGGLVLIPLIVWRRKHIVAPDQQARLPIRASLGAGVFLFAAAALQQIGLQYTSSANSGFITGFYILFVPLLGMFLGHNRRACPAKADPRTILVDEVQAVRPAKP